MKKATNKLEGKMEKLKVNTKAHILYENLGITDQRRLWLCKQLDIISNPETITITPIYERMNQIRFFCDYEEEFAFCLFIDVMYLIKKGEIL